LETPARFLSIAKEQHTRIGRRWRDQKELQTRLWQCARDKVALRFNVADSSLHAWAKRTDSATEHEHHTYGENTLYVKAPKESPTNAWVRNYYNTNKQMPATADIISTRKHLEPNEVFSAL
jgi:hypothetical protein